MLTELENLQVLQERDRQISAYAEELDNIPKEEAKIKTGLENDQAREASAKAAFQQAEIEVKNLELKIATRRDTIGKLQKQQFETKKNDEFAALGSEIIRYENDIDELETEELMAMEKVDEKRALWDEAKKKLAATQAVIDGQLADFAEQSKQVRLHKEEVEAKRAEIVAKIDPDTINLYERLRVRRGNQVVAPVSEAGQCGACHMKVIHTTLSAANAQKELVQCENCGAILFPG